MNFQVPKQLINPSQKNYSLRILREIYEKAKVGALSGKEAMICLGKGLDKQIPPQYFLISSELIKRLEQIVSDENELISDENIFLVATQCSDNTISKNFNFQDIGRINNVFYSSSFGFSDDEGPDLMYTNNRPINYSIGRFIVDSINKKDIRLKELSAGARETRWRLNKDLFSDKNVFINLTDFSLPALPNPGSMDFPSNFTFKTEEYSLLNKMDNLDENDKYDVLLVTYGFDSIWSESDVSYSKRGLKWFRRVQRVKVADWFENREGLLQALRAGTPLINRPISDFDYIYTEEIVEEVEDIKKCPFGNYIENLWKDSDFIDLNFPGNFITRTDEIFSKQLKKGGVLIVGDAGYYYPGEDRIMSSYDISGKVARYKAIDYVLAKDILEKEFKCKIQVFPLDSFVLKYMKQGWEREFTDLEVKDVLESPTNFIMIITQ